MLSNERRRKRKWRERHECIKTRDDGRERIHEERGGQVDQTIKQVVQQRVSVISCK